jgi:hypothetical protein
MRICEISSGVLMMIPFLAFFFRLPMLVKLI